MSNILEKKFGNYTLLKYRNKVFYDNLWTDELVECRGRVVDSEGNTIVNPFTKVFNYQENGTSIPLEEVVLGVQKINGFMLAVTHYNDEWIYSTTGSMNSKFVELGKQYVKPKKMSGHFTLLFEICAREDPHIIEEVEGAYLIGIRSPSDIKYTSSLVKEEYLDWLAITNGWMRPNYEINTFGYFVEQSKVVKHEGYCIYGSKNLKLKSKYYLGAKALARFAKAYDDDFASINIPPEITDEQERLVYIRNYLNE